MILKCIGDDELSMKMKIEAFLASLSLQERFQFREIVAAIDKSISKMCNDERYGKIETPWYHMYIPTCNKRMRSVYIEGSDSILPNVSYPYPSVLDINHSYLSIKDMILHYLDLDVKIH